MNDQTPLRFLLFRLKPSDIDLSAHFILGVTVPAPTPQFQQVESLAGFPHRNFDNLHFARDSVNVCISC